MREFLHQGAIISSSNNKVLLGWGKQVKYENPRALSQPIFYFSNFFLTENRPWHLFENNLELSTHEFIELLQPYAQPKLSRIWHNPYKELFRKTIDDIRRRIYLEELQKAVPFIYDISPTSMTQSQLAASLIQASQLLTRHPLNLYGLWQKHEGILGLTPEVLCSINRDKNKWRVDSFALAGTRDKQSMSSTMKTDPKIWKEHDIVREGIISSLSPFGKTTTGDLEEVSLPTLSHLKTRISLETEEPPHIPLIINQLHPTPALGAFPRLPGMAWLRHYQTLIDRKKFGAPVGYQLTTHETRFYVAIRNVQWTAKEMHMGAGCGIVLGSRFEDEWYEVHLKIKSIKEALAL
jgi:isochorismate synthase EntC